MSSDVYAAINCAVRANLSMPANHNAAIVKDA